MAYHVQWYWAERCVDRASRKLLAKLKGASHVYEVLTRKDETHQAVWRTKIRAETLGHVGVRGEAAQNTLGSSD